MKTIFVLKWKGNIIYLKFSAYVHVKICIVLSFLKDSFSLGVILKRSDFFLFSSKFSKCREKPILSFAKSSGNLFGSCILNVIETK